MADHVTTLVVKVVADAKQAQGELNKTSQSGSKFAKGLGVAAKASSAVLLGLGAAAIHAGKAAAEDAQGQAILANAMRNATGANKEQIAAMEDYIAKTAAATGVADDQLRPALGTLVRATGDAHKSQEALNVALDVSAATGKDVGAVSAALAKGYAGNTAALGRLVPGMDKAVLKSGDMNAIMAELARTTGGAAAASANTAAGQFQRFHLALQETEESAGAALLPVMSALSGVLLTVASWAQKNSTLFVILASAIGVIAAAIVALNVALKIYNTITAITAIVSKAAWLSAAGPILLVVAAVALVVAAIVILWKKSQTFRNVVLAVWNAIKTAAAAVGNVLKTIWRAVFLALTVYVRTYLSVVRVVWSAIRSAASTLVGWLKSGWRALWSGISAMARTYASVVKGVWQAIRSAASTVVGAVKSAWSGVWSTLKSAARGVESALSAPFHAVQSAINAVIGAVQNLIGWLSRIHVPHISLPHIGGLGAKSAPVPVGVRTASLGVGARAGAGGAVVNINVTGALDPEAVARQIARLLEGHGRRVGLKVV